MQRSYIAISLLAAVFLMMGCARFRLPEPTRTLIPTFTPTPIGGGVNVGIGEGEQLAKPQSETSTCRTRCNTQAACCHSYTVAHGYANLLTNCHTYRLTDRDTGTHRNPDSNCDTRADGDPGPQVCPGERGKISDRITCAQCCACLPVRLLSHRIRASRLQPSGNTQWCATDCGSESQKVVCRHRRAVCQAPTHASQT